MSITGFEAWPKFTYEEFKPSSHLLHMFIQAVGKLKLITPFEPEWANVGLWITAQGITTGLIPYKQAGFEVSINFCTHQVLISTTWGRVSCFQLVSSSVADLTGMLFRSLKELGIDLEINPKPQEVPNPILFDEDTEFRTYDPEIVNKWWRILVSSQRIMQIYHAKFLGKTQAIALMWGTLDIRDFATMVSL